LQTEIIKEKQLLNKFIYEVNMIDHLTHLFKYDNWATERTANSIINLEEILPEAVRILSHIISAQQIWLNRITGTQSNITPWDNYTIDESISKSVELTSKWINLLEGSDKIILEKRIQYQNSKGEMFNNSIKDICSHVISHSTYHRAQIAQHVKRANGIPAVTDYIVYQRELQK
jgi:uncharacterized damage-inducible protein DinB